MQIYPADPYNYQNCL